MSHKVVLVDAVAAHAQPSDKLAVNIDAFAPRKKNNPALIRPGRLRALRARIRNIVRVKREERPSSSAVDAWRKKRLCAETDRAIGDRCADGNAGEIGCDTSSAIEINHV